MVRKTEKGAGAEAAVSFMLLRADQFGSPYAQERCEPHSQRSYFARRKKTALSIRGGVKKQ